MIYSSHNRKERQKESPYDLYYYVLTCERERLYRRIEQRVDQMLEAGLIEEVRRLKEMGCTRTMVAMQGLGYKEILDYLDGRCTLDEAVYVRLCAEKGHQAFCQASADLVPQRAGCKMDKAGGL